MHHMSPILLKNQRMLISLQKIEPNQKEYIISALRKSGNVGGYMGVMGINDTPALHAADQVFSVDTATYSQRSSRFCIIRKRLDGIGKRDRRRKKNLC